MADRADTFDRADDPSLLGTPSDGGSDWVVGSGAFGVSTNRAYSTAGGTNVAYLESSLSDVTVQTTVAVIGDVMGIAFRYSNSTNYWTYYAGTGDVKLYKWVAGSPTQVGSTYTGAVGAGDVLGVECVGNSITLTLNGAAIVGPVSDSFNSTATKHGLYAGTGDYWGDFSVTAFAASDPTAVLDYADESSTHLTGTAGTQGTGPYTHQWQRSTQPDAGFTDLTGATTLGLTDGSITPGARYYYRLVVTDSLSAAFTSNVQSGRTWKKPAKVLFVGDSVTAGGTGGAISPVGPFGDAVKKAAGGERHVVTFNAAEGGLKASDWYDAAGAGANARLVTASANGLSAGCTHAMVTLGINDSYSAETTTEYRNNLAGIASYLLGQGYDAVILNYPTGIPQDPAVSTALPKLLSLTAEIDAVVNGTTVLRGDTLAIDYLQDHRAAELQDSGTNVHPNDTGAASVGAMWAYGWARAMGEAPGGAGGVGRSRIVNSGGV